MAKKWIQQYYDFLELEFKLGIDELNDKIKKYGSDSFSPFLLKAIIIMKKN